MSDRLTLSPREAAERLGVSRDHFDHKIMPDLPVVRSGRLRLIPVDALAQWVRENATRLTD